jgi:hypothetical protein
LPRFNVLDAKHSETVNFYTMVRSGDIGDSIKYSLHLHPPHPDVARQMANCTTSYGLQDTFTHLQICDHNKPFLLQLVSVRHHRGSHTLSPAGAFCYQSRIPDLKRTLDSERVGVLRAARAVVACHVRFYSTLRVTRVNLLSLVKSWSSHINGNFQGSLSRIRYGAEYRKFGQFVQGLSR